jgi:hypothetical protein
MKIEENRGCASMRGSAYLFVFLFACHLILLHHFSLIVFGALIESNRILVNSDSEIRLLVIENLWELKAFTDGNNYRRCLSSPCTPSRFNVTSIDDRYPVFSKKRKEPSYPISPEPAETIDIRLSIPLVIHRVPNHNNHTSP